ncbi:hypothetical protein [Jiangella mangrovi]|uniref:Uncharacterized protein n=1 Tax=Jiangella mangrovi TaxID=1524084 RepID=A0A7W9LJ26_9ACTN|nr:hypothetical protein [Jiangella mangrovi]MBB5785593.1 hypothetical protein [Jiangella mangrovi]
MAATEEYERNVSTAVGAVNELSQMMLSDLDIERGGFGWWHGYLDWKRVALISEYTLASLIGTSESIIAAALQVQEHREATFADNTWMHQQLTAAGRIPGASTSTFMKAIQRGPHERRRDRRANLAQEHVFYHLAQCFDRLAATIIGVAAVRADIVTADWRVIESCMRNQKQESRYLEPPGTEPRQAQNDVFLAISRSIQAGPPDWLAWLQRTRDTAAHRAPMFDWMVQVKEGRSLRWVKPLHRQPDWTSTEAMISAEGVEAMFLWKDPNTVLSGMLNLTNSTVTNAISQATQLWNKRKGDTRLLIQPGEQWRELDSRRALEFDGFGDDLPEPTKGSAVHVHPDTARRLKALKLLDANLDHWRSR